MTTNNVLKVFISSANDTKTEREITEEVIADINKVIGEHVKIRLDVIRWENLTPITPNGDEEKIQDVINKHVDKCDIFILILNKRIGTAVAPRTKTNLEIEIHRALQKLLDEKKIYVLTYFKDMKENLDKGEQEKKVINLRKALDKKDVFHYRFKDSVAFKNKFTHHIYEIILRFRFSTSKVAALHKFWNLEPNDRDNNELAIIYPPVNVGYVRTNRNIPYWQDRLVPYVVFEDFKALQKIEKSLRLIEFKNYRFYDTKNIPSNINDINRVWLCLPRNIKAQDRLEKYKEVSKFSFLRDNNNEIFIRWRKNNKSRKYFNIESPLKNYLKLQRPRKKQDWNASLSNIIVKDYAVISRFIVKDSESRDLKEYFIAGIRGLGTWGAGWFIDRMYPIFNANKIHENIQILLEVEYQNNRIYQVKNVTNESEDYFKNQNDINTIKQIISTYR